MWLGRGTLATAWTRPWHCSALPTGAAGLLSLLAVVMAPAPSAGAPNSSQSVPTAKLLVTLQDPNATAVDDFGASLAISGSTAVVGSPGTRALAGAAYIYVDSGSGWRTKPTATLEDPKTKGHDYFGKSVAVSNETVVVGAPGTRTNAGAVYIYVKGTSGWPRKPTTELKDPEATAGDDFGRSVGVSGKTILVGGTDPGGRDRDGLHLLKGGLGLAECADFHDSGSRSTFRRRVRRFGRGVGQDGHSRGLRCEAGGWERVHLCGRENRLAREADQGALGPVTARRR